MIEAMRFENCLLYIYFNFKIVTYDMLLGVEFLDDWLFISLCLICEIARYFLSMESNDTHSKASKII